MQAWVEGYLRAWRTNDPEDIGGLFTDGALYEPQPYGAPWRGRDEIDATGACSHFTEWRMEER